MTRSTWLLLVSDIEPKPMLINDILELVHNDLCEPINVQSYSGNNFFILFINGYSRIMTVMFLKDKYDSFQLFKRYLSKV